MKKNFNKRRSESSYALLYFKNQIDNLNLYKL